MPKTILVYYATWPAVGHAVEALRHARGYALANPGSEIHVVLNSQTSAELADLCPWVTAAYRVDMTRRTPFDPDAFSHVPTEWDYVAYDRRRYEKPSLEGWGTIYDRYRAHARHVFRARVASGSCVGPVIPYHPQAPIRFVLPDASLAFARERAPDGGTHVALLPAGGGYASRYPSLSSWIRILEALHRRIPDVTVHLIGKLRREGHPDVTAFSREQLDELLERFPFCRDDFDIGLFNQLAVAQRCSLMIAPHTGFAFAVLAVGTPWLAISGGRWREYFHVGVPFRSVLPDPARYRAFDADAFEHVTIDREGNERIISMCDDRIDEDLPRILAAAEGLVERRWSFEECMRRYENEWAELYESRLVHWATAHAQPPLRLVRRIRNGVRSRREEARSRRHAASLWAAR